MITSASIAPESASADANFPCTPTSQAVREAVDSFLKKFHVHVDFVELRIPLLYDAETCDASAEWVSYAADGTPLVNRSEDSKWSLDLQKFAQKFPWATLNAELRYENGQQIVENFSTPFESIESWLGGFAVKIYPKGIPQRNWAPYIGFKCCPPNLYHGCNFLSSICTLERAIEVALAAFAQHAPDLYALCDVPASVLLRVDWTSSMQVRDRAAALAILTRHRDIQVGHTHAAGALPDAAARETSLRRFDTSVYINASSEYKRGIIYLKRDETQKTIERLERQLRKNPEDRVTATRLERLRAPEVHEFCEKSVRYEARHFARGLRKLFERLDYPEWDGGVFTAIDLEKKMTAAGQNLVKIAWADVWRPVFTAMWGDPRMSISNVETLFADLRTFYERRYPDSTRAQSSGYRRAQSLINSVIERGYQTVKREIFDAEKSLKAGTVGVPQGVMGSSSWYKTEKELLEAGVSKAMLQALDGSQTSRLAAGVVVQFQSVVECAPVQELPVWFSRVVGGDFDPLAPGSGPRLASVTRITPRTLVGPSVFPAAVDHDANAIDESCEEFLRGIDERAQEPDEPSFFDLAVARAAAGKKYVDLKRAHLAAVDRPKGGAGRPQLDMFTV